MKFEPIKDRLHTIIADNGKEFAALGPDYYFARPYHTWEGGGAERAHERLGAAVLRLWPRRSGRVRVPPRHGTRVRRSALRGAECITRRAGRAVRAKKPTIRLDSDRTGGPLPEMLG